jgi:hypothetical protein
LRGEEVFFGNTGALYENNMVIYDYQPLSYWVQVSGEAIIGTATGQKLRVLPSFTLTWREWEKGETRSEVLSNDQGFAAHYPYRSKSFQERKPSASSESLLIPLSRVKDDRGISKSSLVLTVRAEERERAYPLRSLKGVPVNDVIGSTTVVVFAPKNGAWGAAYSRWSGDGPLTFERRSKQIVDRESESQWSFDGMAVSGPMKGVQLKPLPSRLALWFSIVRTLP